MKRLLFAFVLAWFSLLPAGAESPVGKDLIHFVRDTHPCVAVYENASPAVRKAADELAATISETAGAKVGVVTYSTDNAEWPSPPFHVPINVNVAWTICVYPQLIPSPGIGNGVSHSPKPSPLDFMPERDSSILEDAGDTTELAGEGDRAAVNAVYKYEERVLGVRWFAPGITVVKHPASLVIKKLKGSDIVDRLQFAYRDTDIYAAQKDAAWDAHLHLNGISTPDMTDYGGHDKYFNGAENFYGLVPPEKYFATHPEYFSQIDGERTHKDGAQLCLTNPDVFRLVVDGLVDWANRDKSLTVLGLSPNDSLGGNCQCDNCKAADAKFGGPTGTEIDFVNRVAAAVQQRVPDRKIYVETLAYLYTEAPPTSDAVKPASNVIILYAPLHADVGHGLDSNDSNKVHADHLRGWQAVAGEGPLVGAGEQGSVFLACNSQNLQVWHYAANFAHYLQPLPDWDELSADMKFYAAHGVSGVFVEGDYSSPGEMGVLRTYVVAHLMWNPDQDVWALITDFCNGYYGPAGPSMVRYLRAFEAPLKNPNVHVGVYDDWDKAAYLSPDVLAKAQAALDSAVASAGADGPYRDRVDEAGLGLREIALERAIPTASAPPEMRAKYLAQLNQFFDDLKRFHVDYIGEGYGLQKYMSDMEKAAGVGN